MDFPRKSSISSHTINIAARYAETDKGGVVHHSVYAVWFEMGRTELLRAGGVAYKDLEAAGVFFVVVQLALAVTKVDILVHTSIVIISGRNYRRCIYIFKDDVGIAI